MNPDISKEEHLAWEAMADEIKDNLWGAIDGVQAAIKALEALPMPIGDTDSYQRLLKSIDGDLRKTLYRQYGRSQD